MWCEKSENRDYLRFFKNKGDVYRLTSFHRVWVTDYDKLPNSFEAGEVRVKYKSSGGQMIVCKKIHNDIRFYKREGGEDIPMRIGVYCQKIINWYTLPNRFIYGGIYIKTLKGDFNPQVTSSAYGIFNSQGNSRPNNYYIISKGEIV